PTGCCGCFGVLVAAALEDRPAGVVPAVAASAAFACCPGSATIATSGALAASAAFTCCPGSATIAALGVFAIAPYVVADGGFHAVGTEPTKTGAGGRAWPFASSACSG